VAVRRQSRSRYVLLLLVLTAGTIITLSYRDQANRFTKELRNLASDVYRPIETGFSDAFRPVGNFFRGAFDYGSLKSQNARLRQQIGRLQRQSLSQSDQLRQLQAITALDDLPFAPSLPTVKADVIDSTASNFEMTVRLDRGTGAGVSVGMPVVSGAGLVGRVVQASSRECTVLLITDASSSVGVRDGDVVGVGTGQGHGHPMRIDYVPPGSPVHSGDVTVTSGLQGSLFPPGIPVGKVTAVSQPPDALQETLQMQPVADLSALQFVDVLKWRAGS
jgi:rod shape-determining protein MreC